VGDCIMFYNLATGLPDFSPALFICVLIGDFLSFMIDLFIGFFSGSLSVFPRLFRTELLLMFLSFFSFTSPHLF